MSVPLRDLGTILKETVEEAFADDLPARGAALSYYVLLSLGPLLVLVVGALQVFLAEDRVRNGVVETVEEYGGSRIAETVQSLLDQATVPDLIGPGSIFTLLLLAFGATAAFTNVRGSLNAIWGVSPEHDSKKAMALDLLKARLRGLFMVLLTGLFVAVSFIATSVFGYLSGVLESGGILGTSLSAWLDFGVSIAVTGTLFAAIYRTLPATSIPWSSVWVGAFATAFLFVSGKSLVAWIIASSSWTSYYGPGASVVALLAWIYFSAQLFFLGAEFTQVWSRHTDGPVEE